MTPKLAWLIVTIFGLYIVFAQGQTASRPFEVGRYQIVTVPGNSNENAQVFKIDTSTGATWIKAIGTDDTLAWTDLKNVKVVAK
jgi:hypothetical protein